MIHPDLSHCHSLQEFYDQACDQFTAKYGEHFVLYWQHIRQLAQHCDSYKELGAFQGVSAAAAMLGNPGMQYMMLVDSLHTATHVIQELHLHAPYVKKYIVFHDAKYPPIKDVIDRFVAKNEQWQYLIYDDRSFGYAVLEKNNL